MRVLWLTAVRIEVADFEMTPIKEEEEECEGFSSLLAGGEGVLENLL
jgi:hypothetical protein